MTAAERERVRRIRDAAARSRFRHLSVQALLESPAGRELVARLDAATPEHVAADVSRDVHIRQVALVVLGAREGSPPPCDPWGDE